MKAAYVMPITWRSNAIDQTLNYVPKWAKTKQQLLPEPATAASKCSYHACTATEKLIKPSFTSVQTIKEMLHIPLEYTEDILLCPSHHHQMYKKLKLIPCSGCGACPKQGNPFFRHSPDPDTVSQYLSGTTENY